MVSKELLETLSKRLPKADCLHDCGENCQYQVLADGVLDAAAIAATFVDTNDPDAVAYEGMLTRQGLSYAQEVAEANGCKKWDQLIKTGPFMGKLID